MIDGCLLMFMLGACKEYISLQDNQRCFNMYELLLGRTGLISFSLYYSYTIISPHQRLLSKLKEGGFEIVRYTRKPATNENDTDRRYHLLTQIMGVLKRRSLAGAMFVSPISHANDSMKKITKSNYRRHGRCRRRHAR
jgi:hypothetical protein